MDICFQLHDESGTYCRHIGTSIYSLLKNTTQDVTIHFLCDDTLTPENKELLIEMVELDFGQKIVFYNVKVDDLLHELDREGRWYYSIATFYRLYLLNILPQEVERVICLDADLIIHLDIAELWNEDFGGKQVIAVQDEHIKEFEHPLCKDGVLDSGCYFNAGVLYLNCKSIRENMDMVRDSLAFIKEHYAEISCGDQDAFNCLFSDKCNYVDRMFNVSVKKQRANKDYLIHPAIYHYLNRAYLYHLDDSYGRLYYGYFNSTPWSIRDFYIKWLSSNYARAVNILSKQNVLLSTIYNARQKKIIYWGAGAKSLLTFVKKYSHEHGDYCVDNNPAFIGQDVAGMKVRSPLELLKEDKNNVLVIVMSQQHYHAIRKQLISYGYEEYNGFMPAYMLEESYISEALGDIFNMDCVK